MVLREIAYSYHCSCSSVKRPRALILFFSAFFSAVFNLLPQCMTARSIQQSNGCFLLSISPYKNTKQSINKYHRRHILIYIYIRLMVLSFPNLDTVLMIHLQLHLYGIFSRFQDISHREIQLHIQRMTFALLYWHYLPNLQNSPQVFSKWILVQGQ